MAVATADQRPAARADATADQRARIRGGVVRIDEPEGAELLGELQHVDARLNRDRTVLDVDLENPVHQLDVDDDPVPERDRAVRQSGSAGPGDDRDPLPVRELDHLGDLLGARRENDRVRDVVGPAVHRERRRDAGAVEARRPVGEDVLLPADLDELGDDGVGQRSDDGRHQATSSVRPADSATSSIRSTTSI